MLTTCFQGKPCMHRCVPAHGSRQNVMRAHCIFPVPYHMLLTGMNRKRHYISPLLHMQHATAEYFSPWYFLLPPAVTNWLVTGGRGLFVTPGYSCLM